MQKLFAVLFLTISIIGFSVEGAELTQFLAQVRGGPLCSMCKQLTAFLKERLNNTDSVEQFKENFYQMCDSLGDESMQEECKKSIDHVIDMINTKSPEEICQEIQLCSVHVAEPKRRVKYAKLTDEFDTTFNPFENMFDIDSIGCSFCKQIVQDAQLFLNQSEALDGIKGMVNNICHKINKHDDKGAENCRQVAEAYVLQFKNMLLDQDPETVCSLLGECFAEIDESNSKDICHKCEEIVTQLKAHLSDQKLIVQIKNAAHILCGQFSPAQKDECIEKADQMIELFETEVNSLEPHDTCVSVHLCK